MSIEDIVRRIVREEVRAALEQHRPVPATPQRPAALLGVVDAAALLGVAPQTLRNWRVEQKGPRATRVGRLVKYRREDLEAWLSE